MFSAGSAGPVARQPLFTSIPTKNHLPQHDQSTIAASVGDLQVWPMSGGNYANTRYLPSSIPRNPFATKNALSGDYLVRTLNQFSASPLPYGIQQFNFMGVVDETHYYTFGGPLTMWEFLDMQRLGGGVKGPDGLIVKTSRFTGAIEKIVELGQVTGLPANSSSRGPLFLHDQYVYLTSGEHNHVWKFSKKDLSLQWTFQLPAFSIIKSRRHDGTIAYEYPIYQTKNLLILSNDSSGFPTIVVGVSAGMSYGPHAQNVFSKSVDNLHRLVQHHQGSGHVFAFQDLGQHGHLLYDFSVAPRLLRRGDLVPEESFAAGEDKIMIWERLVDAMEFVGSGNSTYTNTGSFLIPITLEGYGRPNTGYLKFMHGDVFNVSSFYQVRELTTPAGDTLSDVLLPGTYLVGLPLTKTLRRNHVLTESEAHGMNYYGGSVYGSFSFDVSTGVLYVPTGNTYGLPVSDQRAARACNVPGSDVPLQDVYEQYSDKLANAFIQYERGDIVGALNASAAAHRFWFAVEMRRRNIRGSRSARYQRFFQDAIVAIDAFTGTLLWGFPILGHDQRDNSAFTQPDNPLYIYQEYGTNHDVIGSAIVHSSKKVLLAYNKAAVGVYDLDTPDFGFRPSKPGEADAASGLTDMRYPEMRVDFQTKNGLAAYDAFAVNADTYFVGRTVSPRYGHSNRAESLLPAMPVGGDPRISLDRANVFAVWAYDIMSGQVKWIRAFHAPAPANPSIVAYSNLLIVPMEYNSLHFVDMNTGLDVHVASMMSACQTAMPIVNWQIFHMGGGGKWENEITYAHHVEMLTPGGL